jgi:RNA polymerase sigma-70 factor (ECF subfamily)
MTLSGQGVLQGFREGRTQALEALYRTYVDDVIRAARAIMQGRAASMPSALTSKHSAMPDDIADVVQEAFTKAFAPEVRQRFDGARSFAPYLLQIARNIAIDHWRARRRTAPVDVDRMLERLSVETDPLGSEDGRDGELLAVVSRYTGSLGGELRRVHDALYVKGLSQRAAAEQLGIGRQVVRTMEGRLRAGLRRELVRSGAGDTGRQRRHRSTVRR